MTMSSPAKAPALPLVLSLEQITVDESRNISRAFPVPPQAIRDLADNIKLHGQLLEPIIVERSEFKPGKYATYRLVAGYQRLKAIALLDSEGIAIPIAAVLKPEGSDADSCNIDENLHDAHLSLMDLAHLVLHLKTTRKLRGYQIAKRLGKKPAWVSVVMRFPELRKEIQERIHSGEIGFNLARQLADISEKRQDALLVKDDARAYKAAEVGTIAKPKPSNRKRHKVTVVSGRPEPNLLLTLRGEVSTRYEKSGDKRLLILRRYLHGKLPLAKLLAAMGGK